MGKGTAFGKTIFIGDQFVLREVPAILAALPFVTEAVVERTDGEGWALGGGWQMKGHEIFKHWFVDFEFPNEDGSPYRSSGVDMRRLGC